MLSIDLKSPKVIARKSIRNLKAYVGGEHGDLNTKNLAILSSNENPLGCSPGLKDALNNMSNLNRYPDGSAEALRDKIGKLHNIDPKKIVCANGSGEILTLLITSYASIGDEVIFPKHGFLIYPIATKISGANPVVADEVNYTVSVSNIVAKITSKTKIICIANPANPTGTMLKKHQVLELIEASPKDILIILDSAYAEYVTSTDYCAGIDFVDKFPNVVMTRTFSKAYALAGTRLGWVYAHSDIISVLNSARGPFNVSSISQKLGIAALNDQDFIKKSIAHNKDELTFLKQELTPLSDLKIIDSSTNFVLIKFKTEKTANYIYEKFRSNNILTRKLDNYHLPKCLRISVGLRGDNMRIIGILKSSNNQLKERVK